MLTPAKRFMELFKGAEKSHGFFGPPEKEIKASGGSKWSIRSSARTKREPPTLELFEKHLNGTYPLGIIPINERGGCWWGGIDVDDYSINPIEVIQKIENLKYPLIPVSSKSDGLHLLLFMAEEQPCSLVQLVLTHFAAKLGLSGSEIFPKQTKVLTERGDLGNWLCLPFGTTFGNKLADQQGIKKTGAKMTLEEFLNIAEKSKITSKQLNQYEKETETRRYSKDIIPTATYSTREAFSDGPPCLQHLAENGINDGGRNSTLFMMALYYIRVDPSSWKTRLEEANRIFYQPPLSSEEVSALIKSVERKGSNPEQGYKYTCKTQPMVNHCNSRVCKGRKFGISNGEDTPKITGLSKMGKDPSIWFISVGDERIEATTDQLQNYYRFQALCLEREILFKTMKQSDWIVLLQDAMQQGVEQIDSPPDVGTSGLFQELLEEFLTDRQIADDKEELLRNIPWKDSEEQKVYFKLSALQNFLDRQNFKHYSRGKLTQRIKDLGGGHQFFVLQKNRGVNTWFIPLGILPESPTYQLSEIKKGPI